MTPDLYTQIALTCDFPEYGLQRGDVAALIEYVTHPSGGEDGAILEIFNALGDLIDVLTVPVSAIESPRAEQIPAVRRRAVPGSLAPHALRSIVDGEDVALRCGLADYGLRVGDVVSIEDMYYPPLPGEREERITLVIFDGLGGWVGKANVVLDAVEALQHDHFLTMRSANTDLFATDTASD